MDSALIHCERVNRVLVMQSKIVRAILRAESPDNLYLDFCRIAVDDGVFQSASIQLLDPANGDLKMLASWGAQPELPGRHESINRLVQGVCSSGSVCVDPTIHENRSANGAQHTAKHDDGAMVGLPLREAGHVVGIVLLDADSADFFEPSILNLLTELADDLSFSVERLEIDQQRLASQTKLHYLAFYDAQTGLPNRTMLEERLITLADKVREGGGLLCLIDIKLQRVEQILQLLGNAGMDEVLRTLASRLEHFCEADSFIAQLAPGEFALVSLELPDGVAALAFAGKVQAAFQQVVRCGDREIFIQASVGCAAYPLHEPEVHYLLRRARAAADRQDGEFGARLYSPDIDSGLEQRVQMVADLHRALERNEFLLYYQPQLDLKSGEMVGVEILLRWKHPKRGIVSPTIFIPLLEESGLMPEVGTWVLRTACKHARAWQDEGYKSLRIAVNLSAQQFRMADLVSTVKAALDDAGLEPEFLELELTESMILESAERTIQTMHELKKLGVSLSLDDFGTGYSSLNYLRHYPVDRIKIDQSFVRDMTEHASSAALVRSILAMAENLGLTAIAEGVETVGQYGYLRKQLCQEMQGFLFSRPVPMPELTRILQDNRKFESEVSVPVEANRVLLVDDEPDVRAAMLKAFRRESWELLTASSVGEGFELLARHNIGVVISDLHMNNVSGTDFLHQVKEMYPDTMRILLTGYKDFTTVIEAVNQGDLYKVLGKPIDDNLLRESIRDAFRRYDFLVRNRRPTRQLTDAEQIS